MNTKKLCGLAAAGVLALKALAADVYIGVSPYLPAASQAAVQKALTEFALKSAPPGSHIVVHDGWNGNVAADLGVPPLQTDNPSARRIHMQKGLTDLDQWFAGLGARVGEGNEALPAGSGAIRAPEFLAQLTNDGPLANASVVILGSPIYHSPNEPSFSMADTRYPSDGHLACRLDESVYGIADRTGRLANMVVHWWTMRNDLFASEHHAYQVRRFWTLFVGGQAGRLVTFGPDLAETLKRATQPSQKLGVVMQAARNPADSKPTMHIAAPRGTPTGDQRAGARPAGTASAPVRTSPAADMPSTAGRTGIGIAWSAEADVDLWVRPWPGAEEIYFRHQNSPEGKLVSNDIQQANIGRVYEFVEFSKPVDLDQVEVWIDYYAGVAAAVTGQIVLFHEGRTYTGEFHIAAPRGDQATGRNNRAGSPHWKKISLRALKEGGDLAATAPTP